MGRRVIGIDAGQVGGGAAGRNGGFLRAGTAAFYHDAIKTIGRERALRIYEMTLEELNRISEQTKGTMRFAGSLRLAMSEEEHIDCAQQREAMRADGLTVKNYNGPLGRGIFIPGDASFNPLSRCRALAYRTMRDGALLFENTRALSFRGDEVSTPRGRIKCQRVIVTLDGRLETLVPELAGRVRTARLQMLGTAPTNDVEVPCPVSARYGFDFWQQLPDGSVAVGGGRDRSMDTEWTASNEPTAFVQEYLDGIVRDTLKVRAPITHRWAASVSYTKTGLPVLSEVRPGVWVTGGYNGTGNLLGAICARAAARAAFGEPAELATLLAEP
jgi:glycine/D-amino acid oxidase-like deaminating enzyme